MDDMLPSFFLDPPPCVRSFTVDLPDSGPIVGPRGFSSVIFESVGQVCYFHRRANSNRYLS